MNKLLILFVASSLMVQCKSKNKNDNQDPTGNINDTIAKYDPVEKNNPNTNYQPAWKGQTRTFGIKTAAQIEHTIISTTLNNPWSINVLNDNEFIITERDGAIVLVNNVSGQIIDKITTGLPNIALGGQGGLLDLAIDPSFDSNKIIYISFSYLLPSGKNTLAVASGVLNRSSSSLDNVKILYQSNPEYSNNMHFGSRIALDGTGYIYVSSGERSDSQTRLFAQDVQSGLGKILRFDTNGNPHPNNPFIDLGGHAAFVYSLGHRNPQGLYYDKITGKLFASEHGPKGGDELNVIESGKNYGWPIITYGLEYSGATIGDGITVKNGMEQPIYYWDPSISPSGMIVYNSNHIPEWQGNIIMGTLSGQHIVRIRFFENQIAGEERLLESENQRFRDVVQHNDGSVYAITDAGRLYRIFNKN